MLTKSQAPVLRGSYAACSCAASTLPAVRPSAACGICPRLWHWYAERHDRAHARGNRLAYWSAALHQGDA